MLNRMSLRPPENLDARRTITGELREKLRGVPASPFDWQSFDAGVVLGEPGTPGDPRLRALSNLLCSAPTRTHELRTLWKECVVTGAYAWRLAPGVGADRQVSAVAGLLHRLGDLLTIRAI